ncbi:unnamed protein product [Mytilus coruscus]|uniref:Uncharacterized protein n=1 Tax=Mytilus coruscus TaxID=42192 RepID=A0A6J8C0W4_MYTCO|nr:unnamed protein product [Mytilus coruscus]
MQTNDNTEVNDIISKNTIREISANVKSLNETVKSQGEILKTVADLQKNAAGSDLSCTSNQNQPSSQIIETQGNRDYMKVSAGMFPHIQTVSQTQRQNIEEGKYINLVFLLIPVNENQSDTQQIEADGSILLLKPKDHRLQRDLSIHEYIEAFNMFKNIVCEFEDRRVELDMFLQDIIEMVTKFKGNIFYEYHKAFAKKVAAIKLTKGLTVDWSIRDEKLYSSICLGKAINNVGYVEVLCIALKCVTYPIPHRSKATILNKSALLQYLILSHNQVSILTHTGDPSSISQRERNLQLLSRW